MSYEALKHRVVAAIDIGTTYSGYAFSARDDFEIEPLKINANVWKAGARSVMSHKAPTALLLNQDKSFEAFGYEAENRYSCIAEEADDPQDIEKYYFFYRFNMTLHQLKQIRRDTPVKDETGKSLSAQFVFSLAMRYLKDHLYISVKDRIPDIKSDDIKYVLTVSAIWDDPAKQFMREAAKLAGIKEDQLAIALEPEAASIFCMKLQVERAGIRKETFLKVANSGSKYMVVDLGGNIDITVHQRQRDGTLKELRPASGGAWGGISVDDAFKKFLEEIAGATNIENLKDESMEDYIDLFREFETKKRSITSDKAGKTSITMPVTLIDIVKKDKAKKGFVEALKQSKYIDTVNFSKQKLQIINDTFRGLFRDTIEGIIQCIQEILDDRRFRDLQYILMVGGFSECELVQNAVRERFKDKRYIVPDEAGLAVLKGAVLYGHTIPTLIRMPRIKRSIYGNERLPEEITPSKCVKRRIFDSHCVGAIDIGALYSGYAFSTKHDFEKAPLKINANVWNAGSRSLMSYKAPTALLLNPDKSFRAFGYEAENIYSTEAEQEPNEVKKYYFFRRLRIILHSSEQVRRNAPIEDETGKSMPALDVFAHVIGYLENQLFESVVNRYPDIREETIKYVLTVPIFRKSQAKQFTREAAVLAGINEDQLTIVSEHQAASIYCMEFAGVGRDITKGHKYMVVDIGRTVDITVQQRQRDGTLRELRPASKCAWGGQSVDDAFKNFLGEIAGHKNLEKLKDEAIEDYVDIFREFETKKRSVTSEKEGNSYVSMPETLKDIVKRDRAKRGFAEALERCKYADHVKYTGQKLQIDNDTFRGLFSETIAGIIGHIQEILDDRKFSDLQYIVMVGGFSQCELVQNAVRKTIKHKRIIVPDEAELAVLNGAVLYGHFPCCEFSETEPLSDDEEIFL